MYISTFDSVFTLDMQILDGVTTWGDNTIDIRLVDSLANPTLV